MTHPTPLITDVAEFKAIGARFIPRIEAAAKTDFAMQCRFWDIRHDFFSAIKTAEARGMPADDTVFGTLIATDEKDLELKLYVRIATLLRDMPAEADIATIIHTLTPATRMMREANLLWFKAILNRTDPDWPITITL